MMDGQRSSLEADYGAIPAGAAHNAFHYLLKDADAAESVSVFVYRVCMHAGPWNPGCSYALTS